MPAKLAFETIKRINDKYKYLVSGFVRNIYVEDVPESVVLIILLFFYNIINSSILTHKESDKLLSVFEEGDKFKDLGNYSYKLIYKRTRDGCKENDFKDKCHDKTNLLCIILDDADNVFGGYTSIGWKGRPSYREDIDDKAFIFLIRSSDNLKSEIFNAIKGKYTIRLQSDYYCLFGNEPVIWIDGMGDYEFKGGCYAIKVFEKPSDRAWITGMYPHRANYGYHWFVVKEMEVFQLNLNID